jgi:hypothetical protein
MPFLDDAQRAVKRWLGLLGITDRVKVEVGQLEPTVCAKTWTNPDYLEALIVFNDPAVCGPYDLEEVAAHEVFHIPMGEFKTAPGTRERSAEERCVERFSRAMVALWRGTPGFARASLVPKLRAMLGASSRARRAIAAGRSKMNEALLQLMMEAGGAAEREDVPEDVKELLRKLAAAAVTGDATVDPVDEPPAAAADPDKTDDAPPARAKSTTLDELKAQTEAVARKRLAYETAAAREALFRSAPDVFPEALQRRREIYKSAPLDEIERYIAAQRDVAGGAKGGPPKAREAFREPPTGKGVAAPAKNDGGVVLKGGN